MKFWNVFFAALLALAAWQLFGRAFIVELDPMALQGDLA